MASSSPFPTEKLQEIATTACETALKDAVKYEHEHVADWNTQIINAILQALIEQTPEGKQPSYKYITNSTIIQHPGDPTSDAGIVGRRGMHSAVAGYWDSDKDGMYSYKWDGAEKKGMDVVISINWISI